MLAMIPFQPEPPAITPTQSAYRTKLIDAAKLFDRTGWGNQGDIQGVEEDVPIRELLWNPYNYLEYTREAIDAMAGSLQAMGQLEAIQVIYVDQPGVDAEGMPLGHNLIIDGALRYLAARQIDWDHLRVKAQPWQTLTQSMLQFGVAKASARPLATWELGAIILSVRAVYEHEVQFYQRQGQKHPLKRFYTQAELAKRLGCVQSTVHRWLRLATQPEPIMDLLRTGDLSPAQAMEIVARYDDPAERVAIAAEVAEQSHDAPVPSKAIRGGVLRLENPPRPRTSPPIPSTQQDVSYLTLWAPRYITHTDDGTTNGTFALACALHDSLTLLERLNLPHPALDRLLRALQEPAIAQFIQEGERFITKQ